MTISIPFHVLAILIAICLNLASSANPPGKPWTELETDIMWEKLRFTMINRNTALNQLRGKRHVITTTDTEFDAKKVFSLRFKREFHFNGQTSSRVTLVRSTWQCFNKPELVKWNGICHLKWHHHPYLCLLNEVNNSKCAELLQLLRLGFHDCVPYLEDVDGAQGCDG